MSRRTFGAGLVGMAALAGTDGARAEASPPSQGAIVIATIGEPGPLDPTIVTSDLVSIISQHIFETLYAFDGGWEVRPLLAAALPQEAAGGTEYTIPLRSGVRFHDGALMTAADVVASLARWLKLSPRGKQVAPYVATLQAQGTAAVKLTLHRPYAPLLAMLSMSNGAAVVMPAAMTQATGPLTAYVGTGPYRFVEHKPDQYIRLLRFENYVSPPGTPSGYAGARHAYIEELRFVPVPNPTTRVDGMLAGQYQFADSLPAEMLPRLKSRPSVVPVIVKPFGFPLFIFNTKMGAMTDVLLRRAAQAALSESDMLKAAFGDPVFYQLEGSIYAKGTPYYDESSVSVYNLDDPKRAGALLQQAKYNKQPIRIMTSQQYDFLYKMSLVAQQNLQDAGFTVDLQVLDWATLLQHRADPKAWDGLFTYHTFVPEPSLITILDPDYPCWWNTPEKQAALAAFNSEPDPAKRIADWRNLQALFFSQAPAIKVGDFYNLAARSERVQNYTVMPWPFFWNVRLG
jgi:peptide/nickel transport system substrate-binding protein